MKPAILLQFGAAVAIGSFAGSAHAQVLGPDSGAVSSGHEWQAFCHQTSRENLYRQFRKATEYVSDRVNAAHNYVGCLMELGYENAAIMFLEPFIEKRRETLRPDQHALLLADLGVACMRLGKRAKAIDALSSSLDLQENAENMSRLAGMYALLLADAKSDPSVKQRVEQEIVPMMMRAIALAADPSLAKARYLMQLALLEFQLLRLHRADVLAEQSIATLEQIPMLDDSKTAAIRMDAYANMAAIKHAVNEPKAAMDLAQRALSLAPNERLRKVVELMVAPVLGETINAGVVENGTRIRLEEHFGT